LIDTAKTKAYLAGFQHRENLADMMLRELNDEIADLLETLESEE